MLTVTCPSILSCRAIAGIEGAAQCFALFSSALVSSHIGFSRLSTNTGPSALQEPVESNGAGVSDVIWAASESENVHTKANANTEQKMGLILIRDTDHNPEVPLETFVVGEKVRRERRWTFSGWNSRP